MCCYGCFHVEIVLSHRHYNVKFKVEDCIRWLFCPHCPKRFKKPLDLVRHLRIHNSIKPFKVTLGHSIVVFYRHSFDNNMFLVSYLPQIFSTEINIDISSKFAYRKQKLRMSFVPKEIG